MRLWSLSQDDLLEKEMAIHSSMLSWEIPWTEEPSVLQSMGSQRDGHYWAHDGWRHIHTHNSEMYLMFAWWILCRRSGLFALDAPGKSYGGTELQRDASLYTHTHAHAHTFINLFACFSALFQKGFSVSERI